jgi:serine/threonine protein kinase
MTIATGTKLGPYQIQSQLGAGGMGEVYRARDTRLARDVAIKVLPASYADDKDRLQQGLCYAATTDGQRFLVNTYVQSNNPAPMTIVLNWKADVKR